MTDHDTTGLVAVVTGGGSGIGAAIVEGLVAAGVRVAVLDLAPPAASSPDVIPLVADVGDRRSVEQAVGEAAARFGRLDIVVNCAGIGAQGDIAANGDDEWARVFSVNVTSIARVTSAALPWLSESPSAAICNVASIAATAGLPQRALYSASKGAVLALTRAMAADFVGRGIRVNAVAPGTVDTPWVRRLLESADDPERERARLTARQPHGRLVSADEVAEAVLYLVSPRSSSTTGTVLEVDGGMSGLRIVR